MKNGTSACLVGLFLIFCSPPAHYRRQKTLEGPYKRTIPESYSGPKSIVRVKLHEGPLLPIYAREYTFISQRNKIYGRGQFLPPTGGIFISRENEFSLKGQPYKGKLEILAQSHTYLYINHVELEDYLISVLGHEMSHSWPLEALKAQAVVARTYVLHKMRSHAEKPYDVDGTTNHQVYGGIPENAFLLQSAVRLTEGEILTYEGMPAQVFFHSSCGGHTASSAEIWGSELPYLPAKKSFYCAPAPVYRWQFVMSLKELARRLGLRDLRKIEVVERTSSQRVKNLVIYTRFRRYKLSGEEIRRKLGPTLLKSTLFVIKQRAGKLQFQGRGYGHGVGLCQWGSRFMAENHSMDYRKILEHYFPGTRLIRWIIPKTV